MYYFPVFFKYSVCWLGLDNKNTHLCSRGKKHGFNLNRNFHNDNNMLERITFPLCKYYQTFTQITQL